MLKFRECLVCHESHALRPDGRMSIHTDARGARCEEPGASSPVEHARAERFASKRADARATPKRQPERDEPSELDEAFGIANDKRRKVDDRPPRGRDRGIYVTGRPGIVHGGSPGSGKRA